MPIGRYRCASLSFLRSARTAAVFFISLLMGGLQSAFGVNSAGLRRFDHRLCCIEYVTSAAPSGVPTKGTEPAKRPNQIAGRPVFSLKFSLGPLLGAIRRDFKRKIL